MRCFVWAPPCATRLRPGDKKVILKMLRPPSLRPNDVPSATIVIAVMESWKMMPAGSPTNHLWKEMKMIWTKPQVFHVDPKTWHSLGRSDERVVFSCTFNTWRDHGWSRNLHAGPILESPPHQIFDNIQITSELLDFSTTFNIDYCTTDLQTTKWSQ